MGHSPSVLVLLACLGLTLALHAEPQPCSTPVCKAAAAYISGAMNVTANPCDDFFEFACGGWQDHHTIPPEKASIGTFDDLNDRMQSEIRELLEKFNLATDVKNSSNAVAYSAYLYQNCLALGKESNETGLAELRTTIRAIFGDIFGAAGKEPVYGDWNVNFVKAYLAGVTGIFTISVQPDPKNVTTNMFNLDPSSFGLGDNELKNMSENTKEITAYKSYIHSTAKLFCADKCSPTLDQDIDDLVNLESELAKNRLPVEQQRDPEVLYNVFTFKQLQEKSKFDWLNNYVALIVKSVGLDLHITEDTPVLVSDVNYTIKAIEILNKTPKKTLQNYALWRVASHFGPKSSEQFREIAFQFNKVTSGVQKLEGRNMTCLNFANGQVSLALSRLFVEHYFTEAEKQAAVELIGSIQDSYRELIQQNAWLDPKTKAASVSKLNHVTKNVAYPAWLKQNDELDEYYLLQNATDALNLLADKNYLHSLIAFNTLQTKKSLIDYTKPVVVDKNWPMPPAIINAAYEPEQNSITIPAGILKSPFFDAERPFSINYGFIGVVIGHEFTHGLDDEGRQYDEQGNLNNWWTPEAIARFSNRSQCFVDQYSSQVDKTTGLHLNGRNTLGENIADNGGLHESFNAFQTRQAKTPSPTLADLPKFNSEQLFFISFANTWCSIMRPEKLKLQIEYNPHSPAQYRVNVPMSNSDHFAKAFNCPVGSPMNPANKCLLW